MHARARNILYEPICIQTFDGVIFQWDHFLIILFKLKQGKKPVCTSPEIVLQFPWDFLHHPWKATSPWKGLHDKWKILPFIKSFWDRVWHEHIPYKSTIFPIRARRFIQSYKHISIISNVTHDVLYVNVEWMNRIGVKSNFWKTGSTFLKLLYSC